MKQKSDERLSLAESEYPRGFPGMIVETFWV